MVGDSNVNSRQAVGGVGEANKELEGLQELPPVWRPLRGYIVPVSRALRYLVLVGRAQRYIVLVCRALPPSVKGSPYIGLCIFFRLRNEHHYFTGAILSRSKCRGGTLRATRATKASNIPT